MVLNQLLFRLQGIRGDFTSSYDYENCLLINDQPMGLGVGLFGPPQFRWIIFHNKEKDYWTVGIDAVNPKLPNCYKPLVERPVDTGKVEECNCKRPLCPLFEPLPL